MQQGQHQAVHLANADVDAIITLENMSDLIRAKPLVIVCVYMKDDGSDLLVFLCAISRF